MSDDQQPIAYLPGPLICADCGREMTASKRSWTVECTTPQCQQFRRKCHWPSVELAYTNEPEPEL